MTKDLIQRRQLLFYLGLGVVSAGAATTVLPQLRKTAKPGASIPSPSSLPSPEAVAALPPTRQKLPEFQGISQWLNSRPLTLADLSGSVILIQFWTFACINCQRTLPYVTQWHRRYASQGLKVIGIHTAEFPFERDIRRIEQALQQHQITYPVPVDNEFKTWQAYSNQFWPHLFLADRQGFLRYDHIGEGAYDETEQMIRQLLSR